MASDTTQGTPEAAPAAETPFPHSPGVPRSAHGGLPAESAAGSAVRRAGTGQDGAGRVYCRVSGSAWAAIVWVAMWLLASLLCLTPLQGKL